MLISIGFWACTDTKTKVEKAEIIQIKKQII